MRIKQKKKLRKDMRIMLPNLNIYDHICIDECQINEKISKKIKHVLQINIKQMDSLVKKFMNGIFVKINKFEQIL